MQQVTLIQKIKVFCIVSLFCFYNSDLSAQRGKADSLRELLKQDKDDSGKVNHLNNLAWYLSFNNPDTSMLLSNEALILSKKINWQTGIGNSYHQIASFYDDKGDYILSLKFNEKALSIWEQLSGPSGNNLNGFARKISTINNMGIVYQDQGNYPQALACYFRALKMEEKLRDKNRMAITLGNIGTVYRIQHDHAKALDYYFKALRIQEELKDKAKITIQLGNIGTVYLSKKNYQMALNYLFQALKMDEELGNKEGISRHLGNIGVAYDEQKDYSKALNYYIKSLEMKKFLGAKSEIANTLGNIGSLFVSMKKYTEAEKYLLQALAIDTAINSLDGIMETHKNLSTLYEITGKPANALFHYKKATAAKDTLFNDKKNKEMITNEMNYEFDKRETITRAEQEKKDVITETETRKQKIIIWFSVFALFSTGIFAFFMLNRWKVSQQQTKTIEEQKILVEKKNKVVEEKNKDILDSINYAQRIQEAILIPEEEIKKHFSDAFIFFRPKDIVSGDFYWFGESEHNKIIAVADCTGHGVPGGFMSMLGFEMLQQILLLDEVKTTSKALISLDKKITETLNRNNRTYRDGMDMVLCAFSKNTNTLQFSCANRPLILIRDGVLKEFAPDKYTIGGAIDNVEKKFSNKEMEIQKGDMIYMFSDGYPDQFGGPKNKKFKYKQVIEMLLANHHLAVNQQKLILETTFNDWKGNNEQTDDILFIGIKM
ncbi:MAG: tetratricopeptide repeat protein [Bacteroidetes bacterium]|nr:tetratricopeptide repeat protein [Bacteroidota bacterium]